MEAPGVIGLWAPLVTQKVKNLPAVQETHVPSLGQEDPLEKGMVTHSIFPHPASLTCVPPLSLP